MIPRDKAQELMAKMHKSGDLTFKQSKKCALILIQELIEANKKCSYTINYTNTAHAIELDAKVRSEIEIFMIFWENVKFETQKL